VHSFIFVFTNFEFYFNPLTYVFHFLPFLFSREYIEKYPPPWGGYQPMSFREKYEKREEKKGKYKGKGRKDKRYRVKLKLKG
jgi:hypothetical protein